MKNLIFKEFKLSVHPLTYLMMVLISLAALSGLGPSYPLFLFGVFYTFLFIGIKKGVTNNDLYYTLLLPVRKEKVVLARITSTTILQAIYLAMVFVTSAVALLIPEQDGMLLSIGVKQPLVFIAIALLVYTIFDFIYFPWFYKKGKEVIWNMLIGTIVCAIVACGLCIGLAYIPGVLDILTIGSQTANYLIQIVVLMFGVIVYIFGKFLLVKICTKEIKKLDF